ncbi:Putative glycosyltransferase CsbB [Stieleria maiorica]|uniref:Glycosyltransferase CsbB n=1 Tax=Stieleria maiorica TaxID=2795974 RepID=A0A5B9MNI1_9BACT|nr:glycosyltransferase family 2 protein [Stieleria maiorica]QEG01900.1 Putative glycosyltransferase CsbB [Stieleria maiorica]
MSNDELVDTVSIVVPCFNDGALLQALLTRTREACENCNVEFELVIVNDGSTDRSWDQIRDLVTTDRRIVGVDLTRNFGQDRAILAGLSYCTGDCVFVLDADLQDPPELLPEMLRCIRDGADVAYGRRLSRSGETIAKRLTAWGFYHLINLVSDIEVPKGVGNFRLMRREVAHTIAGLKQQPDFFRGLCAWVGYRQVAVNFHRDPRHGGVTHWPLRRMLQLASQAIVSLSSAPLLLPTWIASFATLSCIALLAVPAAATPLRTGDWHLPAMMCLAIANAWVLAIFGLYLMRIYHDAKGTPPYLVRETVSKVNYLEPARQSKCPVGHHAY